MYSGLVQSLSVYNEDRTLSVYNEDAPRQLLSSLAALGEVMPRRLQSNELLERKKQLCV